MKDYCSFNKSAQKSFTYICFNKKLQKDFQFILEYVAKLGECDLNAGFF